MPNSGPSIRSASWHAHPVRLTVLALACLLLFHKLLLHPTGVLYSNHSDLLAQEIPWQQEVVESFRETGEIPDWCPEMFCGVPGLTMFDSGHLLAHAVRGPYVPAVLSWTIVLHLILAGWLAYALAVNEGLGPDGAMVAGLGYMFAGKWLLHLLSAGHLCTAGLAWLPLVLLLLDRAIRQGNFTAATGAGVAMGMICLGVHPQWIFYAGLLVAAWTLIPAMEVAGMCAAPLPCRPLPLAAALRRWLFYGCWTAVLGAAIGAIYLLPSAEISRESTRAASGASPVQGLAGTLNTFSKLTGPGPADPQSTVQPWEPRGAISPLWLVLAVGAVAVGTRRDRWLGAVVLGLLLLSLVGFDLIDRATGFHPFRWPARMIVVLGLPLALLAGRAIDMLVREEVSAAARDVCRTVGLGVLTIVGCQIGLDFLFARLNHSGGSLHIYWYVLPMLLIVAVVLWRRYQPTSRWWRVATIVTLALDLMVQAAPLVTVRDPAEVYAPSPLVRQIADRSTDFARTLDQDLPQANTSPLGPIHMLQQHLQAVRGYCAFDVARYRQFLQMVSGETGPMDLDTGFRTLRVAQRPLLDLLGVRFLLQPADVPVADGWKRLDVDPQPKAYVASGYGLCTVPAYALYENQQALPRAIVVHESAPLPAPPEIPHALATNDFRRRVFLEDASPERAAPADHSLESRFSGNVDSARITDYRPNRVTVETRSEQPGWLFLSDVWSPQWRCTVNGAAAKVFRANYAFRAVAVPAGNQEVIFYCESRAFRRAAPITLGAAVIAMIVLAIGAARRTLWCNR